MKKIWYLTLLLFPLLLTGCASESGGGFDIVAFLKNPIMMALIVIATLYFVWKSRK